MTNSELEAKVDLLQTTLDEEQEQVKTVIANLEATVEEQKAIIADGGTEEDRQRIADKIDAAITDLKGTIAQEETEEEPTEEG